MAGKSAIVRLPTAIVDLVRPVSIRHLQEYTGRRRFRPMSDHVIRLGNAWETPADGTGQRVSRWRRRFGRPGGLGPGDKVVLVVERPGLSATAVLNGVPLPAVVPGGRWANDVTPLLADRNELVLDLATAEPPPEPMREAARRGPPGGRRPLPEAAGAVRLEIVSAARGRPRD